MNDMSVSQFLGIAISLLTLASLVGKWFYDNGRRDSLAKFVEEKNKQQDNKLEILFKWKDSHQEDANNHRLKFEVDMAEMRGQLKGIKESHDGQFMAIMERLTRVENKIDRLEQRHQG